MNDTRITYDARRTLERLKKALRLCDIKATREAYEEILFYRDEYLLDLLDESEKTRLEEWVVPE